MDFPLADLLDKGACYATLLAVLHPPVQAMMETISSTGSP